MQERRRAWRRTTLSARSREVYSSSSGGSRAIPTSSCKWLARKVGFMWCGILCIGFKFGRKASSYQCVHTLSLLFTLSCPMWISLLHSSRSSRSISSVRTGSIKIFNRFLRLIFNYSWCARRLMNRREVQYTVKSWACNCVPVW
jgi:hypothetical protein